MLYSDTMYCSRQGGRQRGNGWSKYKEVENNVAINSNFGSIGALYDAQPACVKQLHLKNIRTPLFWETEAKFVSFGNFP